MAIKVITPQAEPSEIKQLLEEINDTEDEVILEVGGQPVGMVVPLTKQAQDEVLRQSFGRFWDIHEAYMERRPEDMDEDELMEWSVKVVKAIRADRRRINEAIERLEERDRAAQSA